MSARLRAASSDARPAVEAHRLRKSYPGGVEAVRGIDFQVAPGEVFGLLGPNGAGKSTTIGMLTTTIKPTSGSARLAGFDVARHTPSPPGRSARRLPGICRGQGADRPPQP
jgi:ABC-2 type transport system ATP-binding protein